MIVKINTYRQIKGITIAGVHHLEFSKSESHVIISASNRVRNDVSRWSRDSFWHAQPCRLGILSDRQQIPPVAIKWPWNCPLSGLWQYIKRSGNSDRWAQQLSVLLRRSYVAFSVSRAARLTAGSTATNEMISDQLPACPIVIFFSYEERVWNKFMILLSFKTKKIFSLFTRQKFILFVHEMGMILAHSWFIDAIYHDVSQSMYRKKALWYHKKLTWKIHIARA